MSDKIKLLIVDDELKFLEAIAERLTMRGFYVVKAGDGYQALAAVKKEKFDLALLDLKMPGMDGKQVLAELKQQHKYLEVIILTGHGSLESAVECTKLGAFGYLPKPYEIDKLLETLQAAYTTRMNKKFAFDEARIAQIEQLATGESALGILRRLHELDDEEK